MILNNSNYHDNNRNILRLAIINQAPDIFDDCHGSFPPSFQPTFPNCPFPGWTVEIFNMLTAYMNITIELINSNGTTGKCLNVEHIIISLAINGDNSQFNTNWTDALTLVQSNRADTVAHFYEQVSTMNDHFQFAYSIVQVQ
jgi:hypothetical protein